MIYNTAINIFYNNLGSLTMILVWLTMWLGASLVIGRALAAMVIAMLTSGLVIFILGYGV